MPCPRTENKVCVKLATQTMEKRSIRRVSMASINPRLRAMFLFFAGSRLTRMEIKMMLSIPRTISSEVSVAREIQASGLVNHENIIFLPQTNTQYLLGL